MNFDSMPELPSNAQRALIACSLWLHVGFIGVAASAVGLLQLFDGGRTWLPALVLIVSGGALAATSWPRARRVLQSAEGTSGATTGARNESSARNARPNTKKQTLQRV